MPPCQFFRILEPLVQLSLPFYCFEIQHYLSFNLLSLSNLNVTRPFHLGPGKMELLFWETGPHSRQRKASRRSAHRHPSLPLACLYLYLLRGYYRCLNLIACNASLCRLEPGQSLHSRPDQAKRGQRHSPLYPPAAGGALPPLATPTTIPPPTLAEDASRLAPPHPGFSARQ